jgi:hypothetical protein
MRLTGKFVPRSALSEEAIVLLHWAELVFTQSRAIKESLILEVLSKERTRALALGRAGIYTIPGHHQTTVSSFFLHSLGLQSRNTRRGRASTGQ